MEREYIPSTDEVSRWLFKPFMGESISEVIYSEVFQVRSDKETRRSVVWRKHITEIDDVHNLGCADQQRRRENDKVDEYIGCATGLVERVRGFEYNGVRPFDVIHEPSEGVHHAELVVAKPEIKLSRGTRSHYNATLEALFSDKSAHTCG